MSGPRATIRIDPADNRFIEILVHSIPAALADEALGARRENPGVVMNRAEAIAFLIVACSREDQDLRERIRGTRAFSSWPGP